ncbi:MAG: excinuclease ABC subunit UvrA [Chloroflexaceae bacterium]|nr:excinuclease ABC subunit UvrA [Chloroflexaceae bacterium]
MSRDTIIIKGAREHNLKGIDVEIPRDQLVVLTGVSGSGKSSLAFDTLYAEGQRRYVESLSAYARQFLGQMEKPQVDFIEGLSPSIAIEQKSASKNPRSTVGTVTEIYDYLRLLFARIGTAHCPVCGSEVGGQTAEQMVDRVLNLPAGTRFLVLAPLVSQRKGEYKDIFQEARAEGFARVRVDGEVYDLSEDIKLNKKVKHTIEVVVDRLVLPPHPPTARPGNHSHPHPHSHPSEDPAAAVVVAPGDASEAAQEWQALVTRLTDSIETALRTAEGKVVISVAEVGHQEQGQAETEGPENGYPEGQQPLPEAWLMSETNTCTRCGISFPELSPQMFSFNSPQGACPDCTGLGTRLEVDMALLLPDPTLSLHEGAIPYWGELRKKRDSWGYQSLVCVSKHYGFDLDAPWEQLTEHQREVILYGSGKEKIRFDWSHDQGSHGVFYRPWEGVRNEIMRRFQQTESNHTREFYAQFMSEQPCPSCQGTRLRPESLAVTVGGRSIHEVCRLNIREASAWVATLLYAEPPEESNPSHPQRLDGTPPEDGTVAHRLTPTQRQIAGEVLKEIRERLQFLLGVGLHYLTLERAAPTLSGGEAQRIRLASQIGSGLVGVTYILDEPSIGLHQRDNRKLLTSLTHLRDLGNTVVVVEHDLETMQSADWIIDFGPGAGVKGGQVVAAGPPAVVQASDTLTGAYLDGRLQIETPSRRRLEKDVTAGERKDPRKNERNTSHQGTWLEVQGASMNNLRDLDVRFPLRCFVAVTGVSGSGKSSLISETLYPALAARLQRAQLRPGPHRNIVGVEHLDKVINIDQQPIGRTPRSNPATYVKLFDLLRELFAGTPEARLRGYPPGRFSFNLKGGRCEACEGNGVIRIDMQFLPDVWVRCDNCKGKRYNRETLQVKYKGKTIADVLDMDVQTALEFFDNVPRIRRILQTLHDVGLDYIRLGQPATTLSGGEAQRVKLARELARVATGRTLYILDEPTTGLHFADIQHLLKVLHRLVDAGNTVVVIEHNLDVIKTADWVIDLGPEGGDGGGTIVAEGTPEQIAQVAESFTGQFLADILTGGKG